MKRWISFLLPLIGLALFVVVVASAGPKRILEVFRSADPVRLALTPVIIVAIILVRGIRWRYLIRLAGIEYPLRRAITVWVIGFFASSVTPAKAGDAIRAFYLKNETDRSFGEAFVTVFVDRLWDLMFVLVSGMITVLIFSRLYMEIPSIWVVLAGAGAIIAIIYMMTNRELVQKILKPIFNALTPERFKQMFSLNFHTFYDSLASFERNWKQMLIVLLLTLTCWGLIFFLAYYVCLTFAIDVPFVYMMLIMPIVTFVELVPISISGLGTRDATVVYFFSLIGIASAEAVGFSIGYLLMGTYLTSLVGFLFWLKNPVKLGE